MMSHKGEAQSDAELSSLWARAHGLRDLDRVPALG